MKTSRQSDMAIDGVLGVKKSSIWPITLNLTPYQHHFRVRKKKKKKKKKNMRRRRIIKKKKKKKKNNNKKKEKRKNKDT
ncbi:hypothetical protein J1N35_006080 [Gossypium stocksii]|uniref:Uncharacterized protein n=1 Tax=Gossypium stocksii TaxID=47602 RepID=A0A9D3WGI5_9ROSI|nr:hypothetical protein J1N35_006080 [Gossypium stocksii]